MDRLTPRVSLLVLCMVFLSLAACSASETPTESSSTVGTPDYAEFEVFWTDFRSAVLNGDDAAVADLTRFPFQTRGEMDDDPIVSLAREDFMRKLPVLLEEDPGLAGKPRTQRGLIQSTLDARPDSEASARVGNFEFEIIDGRWWFVFAYVGGDAIE